MFGRIPLTHASELLGSTTFSVISGFEIMAYTNNHLEPHLQRRACSSPGARQYGPEDWKINVLVCRHLDYRCARAVIRPLV